jgi:hypothetical protein
MSIATLPLRIVPASKPKSANARKDTTKSPGGDAATSDKLYSEDDAEFLKAVDAYRTTNNRRFVTPTECLSIARSMGYAKVGMSA